MSNHIKVLHEMLAHVAGKAVGSVTPEVRKSAVKSRDALQWALEGIEHLIIGKKLIDHLTAVIEEVHAQHADDMCWMPADVNKIFIAAGLPPQDLHVGDKPAMRKNCDRYIDVLCEGGKWRSYAELEAALHAVKAHPDFTYMVTPASNTLQDAIRDGGWERNPEAEMPFGDVCWRRREST